MKMRMDKIEEVLTRGVGEILPDKKGLADLMRKKKIRLYLGIDPTGAKLHLGHSIPLRKLQQFADLGHEAILVMGTGTVLAGDPSQRDSARPKITQKEIDENIKTWKKQVERIIDFSKITVKQNGDWLHKLNLTAMLDIASRISAFQLIKREMFQRRNQRGDTVWTHEILYPLLQGYDSVAMDVDLEIGGTDQTFNMLVGRELQKKMNNREKYVLTVPMILGTDGKPMSKTSNNCIWLDDKPSDIFAKVMSIPDEQIKSYFILLTDTSMDSIDKSDPLAAKKRLAFEITKNLRGEDDAKEAQNQFEELIQHKNTSSVEIPMFRGKIKSGEKLSDILVLVGLASSKSDAKRTIEQGGVTVEGKQTTNPNYSFSQGLHIVGRANRKFIKITV